jgi:signal transduction histidine kinase
LIDVQQRRITELAHEIRTPLNAVIGYAQITSEEVLGIIMNRCFTALSNH